MGRKTDQPKRRLGFALMDPERRRQIARAASERSRRLVNGHRWDAAEASLAAMKTAAIVRAAGTRRHWTSDGARAAALQRWATDRRLPASDPPSRPPPMRACDAALLCLREAGIRSVCRNDVELLEQIAVRARLRCQGHGRRTALSVIRSLERNAGRLVVITVRPPTGRKMRAWYRPECAPRPTVSRDRPAGTGGTPSPRPRPSP